MCEHKNLIGPAHYAFTKKIFIIFDNTFFPKMVFLGVCSPAEHYAASIHISSSSQFLFIQTQFHKTTEMENEVSP